MLEQFVSLKEGDVVVQNGGNSSVGKYVIAIARSKGVKTINIVRDRSDWLDTVSYLEGLGADLVATPETVREAAKSAGLPPPVLGLNCVGGEVATTMLKMLAKSGTLVTYGAMAKLPVSVPAPLLIFKVRTQSWTTAWMLNSMHASPGAQRACTVLIRTLARRALM